MSSISAPRRRHAAVLLGTVVAAAGLAVGTAPAVQAQAARDVPMAHPLGGEHTMRFGAFVACHWDEGKGNSPVEQALNANAYDVDVRPAPHPFDLNHYFPFNSATVHWTNTTTGASGSQTVQTVGREVGVRDIDTGIGDLVVRITASRSAFPTLSPGSVAPFASATHTEEFHVPAIDVAYCEGPIG